MAVTFFGNIGSACAFEAYASSWQFSPLDYLKSKGVNARERLSQKEGRKSNSNMHWTKFKAIRNKVNSELKKAKKNYFAKRLKIVSGQGP